MSNPDASLVASQKITVEAMRFQYAGGEFALNIASLAIEPKEKLAFIGPSGSGKTTLLNLLAGSLSPNVGQIRIGDFDVSTASDDARRAFRIRNMGLVFQEFELVEALSVRENILMPFLLENSIGEKEAIEADLLRLTEAAGIGHYLKRKPRDLSQGERQRVAICRALVANPSIVLADEPTGNLDPRTRESVLGMMEGEIDRLQATLIAVTHDHSILSRFDRVLDFKDFMEPKK